MKKSIVTIIMALSPFLVFSQTSSLQKITGKVEQGKITEWVFKFKPVASFDNSFTYLLLPNEESVGKLGKLYRVEKYDMEMKLIKRVEIDLKEGDHNKHFNELIYFQEKLYLFSSFGNEKEMKAYLFVQTMDKTTFEVNDDIRMLAEMEYDTDVRNFRLQTNYSISEDGTKLLIYTYPDAIKYVKMQGAPSGKKLEEKRQFIYVFDKNLDLYWEGESGKAINSGIFVFDKYIIDNDANVYITGKNYDSKEDLEALYVYSPKKVRGDRYYTYVQPSNYSHSILFFGNKGKIIKQLDLKFNDISPKSITIKPKNNTILCAGVFSAPNTVSAKGIFTCNIKINDGSIENTKTKLFDKKYLETRLNTEDLEKFHKVFNESEWDPFNYSLSELTETESGDYVFIAEQQLNGRLESNNGKMISIYSTFNYRDMFSVRFSQGGEIKQIEMIEKSQFGLDNIAHSYNHLIINDALYLLFNNIPPKTGLMKVAVLENTCLVKIDKNGEQFKKIIKTFDDVDRKTIFMRSNSVLSVSETGEFIYPLQSMRYKYRAYEKIRFN